MAELIPVYVFSNTRSLDFHELSVPQDHSLTEQIRSVTFSKKLMEQELTSPLILFAKRVGDKLIWGAKVNVEELNELSSRYYRVLRCDGKTLTQATVTFVTPVGSFTVLSQELLVTILREAFSKQKWTEDEPSPPLHLVLKVEKNLEESLVPALWLKSHFRDKDELFYQFNAEVQSYQARKKFEITFSLRQNECRKHFFASLEQQIKVISEQPQQTS